MDTEQLIGYPVQKLKKSIILKKARSADILGDQQRVSFFADRRE
jgi:hypothetical protein